MDKTDLQNIPDNPGVYIFRNKNNKIIYIGKALSLKRRVSSYFNQKNLNLKNKELVENITKIETIKVSSEFEAILLEAKLIKQHKPKFNVTLKDDKSNLYILIGKEKPQRIFLGRKSEIKKENLENWYGPFANSKDAREILNILRKIFPFRSCKKLPKKPCLYYHIKLCPGVCIKEDKNYYLIIKNLKRIFEGKTNSLLKDLEKELREKIKEEKFEDAQKIKEKIDSLKLLSVGWKNIPVEVEEFDNTIRELRKLLTNYQGIDPLIIKKIEGYDVSNLGNNIIVGSMVTFVEGKPEKSLYRRFNLKFNLLRQDDPEGIKTILRRRLNHQEWLYPQLILIDGGKTQLSSAFEALKEKNLEKEINLIGLAKKEETLIIPKISERKIASFKTFKLPTNSRVLRLLQSIRDEAHRFAQSYYKLVYRKNLGI